jgi:hypothetical protein
VKLNGVDTRARTEVRLALSWGIKFLLRLAERQHAHDRVALLLHQAISILFVVILVIGLASIWFSDRPGWHRCWASSPLAWPWPHSG